LLQGRKEQRLLSAGLTQRLKKVLYVCHPSAPFIRGVQACRYKTTLLDHVEMDILKKVLLS
jgi:hypothetical protein